MIQDESFFCDNCDTCIGHGLIVEQICFRHGAICIYCRWDMINQIIIDNDLSIINPLQIKPGSFNDSTPEQIKKHQEIFEQIRIINWLDKAVANFQGMN